VEDAGPFQAWGQRLDLAVPSHATPGPLLGLDPTLGGGVGRSWLTERRPRQLKQSIARCGVRGIEFGDVGENDANGIAPLDETRRLIAVSQREREEDGVTGGQRLSRLQREYRITAQTSLDLPDPLFIGGVDSHEASHRGKAGMSFNRMSIIGAASAGRLTTTRPADRSRLSD
jgi:hypothetical protein